MPTPATPAAPMNDTPLMASASPPVPALHLAHDALPEGLPDALQDNAQEAGAFEKLVPLAEAIRYRKRAQTAEQQLAEFRRHVADLERKLDESRDTITSLERRQKIDAALTASDAIDLEAARLLTEISVSQMDEPDVAAAVRDLRRHKPYLFRHRADRHDGAMSPRLDARLETQPSLEEAADRAASTGDRRDLLAYLRLRRQ